MKAKWLNVLFLGGLMGLSSCLNNEDPNAQLKADVKLIDDYLAIFPPSPTDYLFKDNSGIRFVVHEFGEGRSPKQGDDVKVVYQGKILTTGASFSSGTFEGKLESLPVTGLAYAVSAQLEGASVTVYVPSDYGYGDQGTTNVPANTVIVYDFFFEEMPRTATELDRFELDTAAIHDYLEAENITATELDCGLSYSVEVLGTGEYPVLYDFVTLTDYKMYTLAGTTPVDQGTLNSTLIFNLIDGLKSGLPHVPEGSKVTFYIPSELGYGPSGSGTISSNTNLRFETTFTSIDN